MSSSGILPCSALLLLVTLLSLSAPPPCHGAGQQQPTSHNITAILLAANPSFADFSSALASANLTAEIDRRKPVTVLAVDDAAVAQLKGRRLAPASLARVLSLHVILDYFDDARLRGLSNGASKFNLAATLYQASGAAPGAAGLLNVSAGGSDGRVAFLASGASPAGAVFYQRSVKESRDDISVLQVSGVLSSPAAEGKAPPATPPPQAAPSPAPAVAAAPAPAPAPAGEAPAPSPKSNSTAHPAPAPKPAAEAPAPAEAPEPDEQPPADQQKNAASGTEEWSLGAPVAAVVLAVVFLMW